MIIERTTKNLKAVFTSESGKSRISVSKKVAENIYEPVAETSAPAVWDSHSFEIMALMTGVEREFHSELASVLGQILMAIPGQTQEE